MAAAPCFAIRRPAVAVFTLGDYVNAGIMSDIQAELLRAGVRERKSILVAGGTSTGKTTQVNALLAEVAKTGDRMVLIEDTRGLQCAAPNFVALRTKDGAAGEGIEPSTPTLPRLGLSGRSRSCRATTIHSDKVRIKAPRDRETAGSDSAFVGMCTIGLRGDEPAIAGETSGLSATGGPCRLARVSPMEEPVPATTPRNSVTRIVPFRVVTFEIARFKIGSHSLYKPLIFLVPVEGFEPTTY